MPKKSKNFITIIIIALCIAGVLGVKFYFNSLKSDPNRGPQARVKGLETAPIHIVEYIDFECPACAEGAKYLKKYTEENPDQIYLEMKYFPLRMHKHSRIAAGYAECAARQDKFWPVHNLLIERQNQWKRLEDAQPAFKIIAQDAKLDTGKLDVCLQDESVDMIIDKDRAEGDVLSIKSTPTYFINGKMFVGYKNLILEISNLTNAEKN